ncbi:pitrilysin family protein [Streptomyces sp. NPDC002033]|uniref:M16 family metallopeptidase n=1 Tax=unclassified Streptomyces TaxID=2593676 RepID=UPI0033212CE5
MSPWAGRLPNGLALTVERPAGEGSGLVSVALTVAAGGDDDPAGAHGTAHLVEHLMFPRAAEGEGQDGHVARIEGAGGVCNAETHRDHTVFHTTVPAGMLPAVLEWEAERLLGFAPEEAVVRTETAVIGEEIRGAAAGGRVWEAALGALHPGRRDSFGTPAELARVTAGDAAAFFRRHYRAGAMALSVAGDVDPDRVAGSVATLFADLPGGGRPPGAEGVPRGAGLPGGAGVPGAGVPGVIRTAPLASPVSGAALGHPLPDPVADRHGYLAHVVLAEVLGRGVLPRFTRRDPRVASARITCGYHGQWLGSAAPDLALVLLACAPGAAPAEAADGWPEVLAEVAARPPAGAEHRRALNSLLLACHRAADSLTSRAVAHGRTALLFPGASPAGLPHELARVTPADVSEAARALLAGPRSVTELGGTP